MTFDQKRIDKEKSRKVCWTERERDVFDFTIAAQERLDRFRAWYASQARANPRNFPYKLKEDEWWERFDRFDMELLGRSDKAAAHHGLTGE